MLHQYGLQELFVDDEMEVEEVDDDEVVDEASASALAAAAAPPALEVSVRYRVDARLARGSRRASSKESVAYTSNAAAKSKDARDVQDSAPHDLEASAVEIECRSGST